MIMSERQEPKTKKEAMEEERKNGNPRPTVQGHRKPRGV
jgi:hypothetical protein